jgi:hypothetical protein
LSVIASSLVHLRKLIFLWLLAMRARAGNAHWRASSPACTIAQPLPGRRIARPIPDAESVEQAQAKGREAREDFLADEDARARILCHRRSAPSAITNESVETRR